jgi:hypothetical protein
VDDNQRLTGEETVGAIGFGAGVRPVGAGRVQPRRRRIDTGTAAPPGGGDIRSMRKVGGFNSYSAVGFRATPPIDWTPMPADPEPMPADPEPMPADPEPVPTGQDTGPGAERELASAGAEQ